MNTSQLQIYMHISFYEQGWILYFALTRHQGRLLPDKTSQSTICYLLVMCTVKAQYLLPAELPIRRKEDSTKKTLMQRSSFSVGHWEAMIAHLILFLSPPAIDEIPFPCLLPLSLTVSIGCQVWWPYLTLSEKSTYYIHHIDQHHLSASAIIAAAKILIQQSSAECIQDCLLLILLWLSCVTQATTVEEVSTGSMVGSHPEEFLGDVCRANFPVCFHFDLTLEVNHQHGGCGSLKRASFVRCPAGRGCLKLMNQQEGKLLSNESRAFSPLSTTLKLKYAHASMYTCSYISQQWVPQTSGATWSGEKLCWGLPIAGETIFGVVNCTSSNLHQRELFSPRSLTAFMWHMYGLKAATGGLALQPRQTNHISEQIQKLWLEAAKTVFRR